MKKHDATTRALERAALMLRTAAEYIQTHCPDEQVRYDGTECDGHCVVEDCLAAAGDLESARPR